MHGVTTAIGGNCGFTVAPLSDSGAGFLMRLLARLEGMLLVSLEEGVPRNWRTTGEYLERRPRRAINTRFIGPSCAPAYLYRTEGSHIPMPGNM